MPDAFDLDLFDVYQQARIGELYGLQANTDQRLTKSREELVTLERRYEHLRLLTIAMWKLIKERTGATDQDLRELIQQIDLLDGKRDGKITRHRGVTNCTSCGRRILKTAVVCVYCGAKHDREESFHGT